MADNFNLRQFLTENKLTRNAKLLKEQEELSYPFGEFGQAVKDIFEHYNEEAISDAPDIVYEMIAELIEEYDLDTMSGEIDTDPMEARLLELYKAAQTMDTEKFGEFAYNELSDGSLFIGGDEDDDLDETSKYDPDNEEWEAEDDYSGQTRYVSRRDIEEEKKQASSGDMAYTKKAEKRVSEGDWRNNPYTSHNFDGVAAEAKKHKHLMKIANELFPQYGGNLENFKPLSPLERQQVYRQYTDDTKVIPFKESKLTAKERRLVEMVQDALGMAPQAVAEDEMVKQKALPKYENIEKLMQEIEHGTNEAAYKHKMAKMKEVAEMLEARVGSLEEGEGAEFVDTKKVKQMKKDIMTLRKQAEKLEKEYDKKFGEKKSKKEKE